MDRRIQKSKKAILDALTKLMMEKDFDKITINEIADEANVNRGTVYLHYVDKYDLLNHCIEAHLNMIFEGCIPKGATDKLTSKAAILRIFENLEQHSFFYSNMLTNKGIPTFRNQLHDMIHKIIEEYINMKNITIDASKEVFVQYIASATVGVIEWWITNSMPYPAEDMVEQLWLLFEKAHLVHEP